MAESFLTALRIFISRRECPLHIVYSDNGRNFVGASAQIKNFPGSREFKQCITAYTSHAGIYWSFIPSYFLHMGGLWEAGVKSMNYHLRRNLGECTLNHQEAKAVLVQIEAVLNSRPLTPASTHPSDMEALILGHFIIRKTFNCISEPNHFDAKIPRLRWHIVQKLVQIFWKRWRIFSYYKHATNGLNQKRI